jgi:hypothetical protein
MSPRHLPFPGVHFSRSLSTHLQRCRINRREASLGPTVNPSVMNPFTKGDLIGTWRVVRTEIPAPYNPDHEFFHFSPNGVHSWEHPFLAQRQRVFSFCYELTDTGVRLTNGKGEYRCELSMRFEGDLLVITGPHGYSSWLQRILAAERPPYLSQFYEPPETSCNA